MMSVKIEFHIVLLTAEAPCRVLSPPEAGEKTLLGR
jgi:hypothetical protein